MSRVAPRQTTGSHHVDPKVGLKMLFQMPETA